MAKKILIIFIIFSILQPPLIMGKMSLEEVRRKNLEAELIVIAEVYDKGAALLLGNPPKERGKPPLTKFIVLKVVHVIKGDGKIKPESRIHVLSQWGSEKQHDSTTSHTKEISPLQAERGVLVILYADTVPNNPGFYKPLLAGASIITIGRPL